MNSRKPKQSTESVNELSELRLQLVDAVPAHKSIAAPVQPRWQSKSEVMVELVTDKRPSQLH